MKHFIPPGTKRYNKTFCAARDQIAKSTLKGSHVYRNLSRQGPKGTMKHFVPPGTKQPETCDPSGVRTLVKIDPGGVVRLWQKKRPYKLMQDLLIQVGGDLLSHRKAVPSALRSLTSLFGMGRGEPPRYNHQQHLSSLPHWVTDSISLTKLGERSIQIALFEASRL